jgi:hypothetical protein
MEQVKMTIEQLEQMVKQLKNQNEYHDMEPYVLISIKEHWDGKKQIEFEQPNGWAECNSNCYRFS